jgi:AcrR family transcriptional regulator
MTQRRSKPQTIDLILTAAERVVLRHSVLGLTLDAVAREAKLSKGGVLYHFATKEALVQAMLERLVQYYEGEIEQHQQDDAGPGRWTRAYVRASFAPMVSYPGEADFPKSKEVNAGIIVAAATNPKLLAPLRQRFRAWQRAIERDGIGLTRATVVRLAVDGLWLADVLGLWSLSSKQRQQVFNELIRLTYATEQGERVPKAGDRKRSASRRQPRSAERP